ncbi:NUDIX hydrolase [Anaerobacillus arseniciselenatis]|uniref:NUDIX hydrolase n=1 Tax=Anaerobacillus arseniciselenatis TaxID=85682 RepID=UPI000AA58265|nr:NUDIX hydrolase [Anaerobacillus arseniciselenatis]
MKREKYHRALGVYGICENNGKLLVVNKTVGPYKSRFDLPGGSLEVGESLTEGLGREFFEETGFAIKVRRNLGVIDFMLPWQWRNVTHLHHIAAFYSVQLVSGGVNEPNQVEGQDANGALWISKEEVTSDNVSPLVVKAFQWLETRSLGLEVERFESWDVRE